LLDGKWWNCVTQHQGTHTIVVDDVTTMDFVVFVLVKIFRKSEADAESLMLKIHNEGSAIVGTYSHDIAKSKANYTMNLAKANNYPLQLTIEESR
jgi:ATP-dependent Clp protease adaptor protein ClpS